MKMTKRDAKAMMERLRVIALPLDDENFDPALEYDYGQFLDLHVDEQLAFVMKMPTGKASAYVYLSSYRAHWVERMGRKVWPESKLLTFEVFAYEIQPGVSRAAGFTNDRKAAEKTLRKVRAEIVLEDDVKELPPSHVYAYDLERPSLSQLLSALNGDAELSDLILTNRRVVATVSDS
ncbi:hypothetical protein ACTJK5_10875 [Agrobacterium sp. 22094]|uniref:hypothetical protein n=1 Tax=Agrobacterium sp. 22094 TaxID=3453872 RepID=UPI003F8801F5